MNNNPETKPIGRLIPPPSIDSDNPYSHLPHPEYEPEIFKAGEIIKQAYRLQAISLDFSKIFQDECLIFLLTADREHFLSEHTGERDERGYLIDKDGNETSFLPSQCVTAGLDRVSKNALEKFFKKREEIRAVLES